MAVRQSGHERQWADWLIAIRAPQLGPRRLRAGLKQHGDIQALRRAACRGGSGLPPASEAYLKHPDERRLAQDLEWLSWDGHHLLCWEDEWYPPQLADAADAPMHLFVRGDPAVLWQAQIAVVGSRRASRNGLWQTEQFVADLSRRGFVITSGLAQGIDACAHRTTLSVGGRTVAVLGSGIDVIYPSVHGTLAEDICRNGALVSEWPPQTPARPGHFPVRNRIVSGLSLGVLVVEAGEKSGSLITARLAAEQGREVMAVPGPAHHAQSRGCHRLIRDGARLVDCAADIVEDVRPLAGRLAVHLQQAMLSQDGAESRALQAPPEIERITGLSEAERSVLLALEPWRLVRPLAVDEIVEVTDLTAEVVSSMLLLLELRGLVASHAGGTWSRLHEMRV